MNTKRLEQVPIEKLVPYARNARTHNKEQITQLRASLREFGFVSPAVMIKITISLSVTAECKLREMKDTKLSLAFLRRI